MGVKQVCLPSPTLFVLCIDKLEGMVKKAATKEELDGLKVMHELIFVLLFVDDMQHILWMTCNT